MANIIVVFPKIDDGKNIRNLLVRNGYTVNAVFTTGTQLLNYIDSMHYGIIVSGYRYADMVSSELAQNLPPDFPMIVMASPRFWADSAAEGITYLGMPIKIRELLSALETISMQQERRKRRDRMKPKQRNDGDRELVQTAKRLLMEKRGMEEEDAYRYIQKNSMDSGNSLVDVAKMILAMYGQ